MPSNQTTPYDTLLDEIRVLYDQGAHGDAIQLLDSLLVETPGDEPARMLRGELCLKGQHDPAFVGEVAGRIRLRKRRTARGRAILDGAAAWADAEMSTARGELARGSIADALACLGRAAALMPWDPGVSLAQAILLIDYLKARGDAPPAPRTPPRLPALDAALRDVDEPARTPKKTPSVPQIVEQIEAALGRVRSLTRPGDDAWTVATLHLADVEIGRGGFERASALLDEAARSGADVTERIRAVNSQYARQAIDEALSRSRQLLQLRGPDRAEALITACLALAPACVQAWLAAADLLLLRGLAGSALTVYRWARDAQDSPPAADVGSIRRLSEQTRSCQVACPACTRPLGPGLKACGVCGRPLPQDVLLSDRFRLAGLPTRAISAVGLASALSELGDLDAACRALADALPALPDNHPSREPLAKFENELRQKRAAGAADADIAAALDAYQRGDWDTARGRFAELASRPGANETPLIYLALTAGAPRQMTDDLLPVVRQAISARSDAWAATPLADRERLVNTLIACGRLAEARDLLRRAFSMEEQGIKRCMRIARRLRSQIDIRCQELAGQARTGLDTGDAEGAIRLAGDVLALDPENLDARLVRGEAYLARESFYPAADDYRAVIGSSAGQPVTAARVGLARVCMALDDLAEALREVDEIAPGHAEADRLRATIQRRIERRPAVRVTLIQSRVDPDSLQRVPAGRSLYQAVFGIELTAAARWQPGDRLSLSRQEMLRAGHDFVSMLGGLSRAVGGPAFTLRLVSHPCPDDPSQARLGVALLCRVTHGVPEGAEQLALELWQALSTHLPLAEDFIYQYEPVYDEADLAAWLEPFAIRTGAEIVRREAFVEEGYLVYPFSTGATPLQNLARILLRESEPCLLDIYLQPVELLADEKAAFQRNSRWLRRSRLPGLAEDPDAVPAGDAHEPSAVFHDPERGAQLEMLASMRHALEKQPFLVQVTAASARPNHDLLAHALAAELCGPGGRYEIVQAAPMRMMGVLRSNLRELAAERWASTAAPDGLRRLRWLVNEVEAGLIFRVPMPDVEGIPGLRQIGVKAILPGRLPADGLRLGESVAAVAGATRVIRIRQEDRRRHMYIVGRTGTGKSTLLEAMALQDIEAGRGVAVLDPHGDLIETLLAHMPPSRAGDVIVFDPSDEERPIGLNFLEAETDSQRHRIATEFIQLLTRLYDPHQTGIVGPRFQHNVRMAMLTVMLAHPGATLIEVVRALTDNRYIQSLLPKLDDPLVKRYWTHQIANTSDFHKSEVLDYIVSKFSKFVNDRLMRNIVGQSRSALNFRSVMDERKILLVNLSKGRIGPESASFLGFLLLQSLLIAALSRADQAKESRQDYCVYVDEFQTFATESFASMLSEGRKYGLCLVMANQYLGQLPADLRQAVFGNVGSLVAFRVGVQDAQMLEPEFYPVFSADDLLNLPRYAASVRLLVDGLAARPFAMRTRLVRALPDTALAKTIREASRRRYGRDVADVTREIDERFALAA